MERAIRVKCFLRLLVAFSFPFWPLCEVISQARETSLLKPVDLLWGLKIPLRDGVKLNATAYKPKADGPLPVVFTLTPYISDRYHSRAYYFAQNNYVYVLVDGRGRGNSEGSFTPYLQEGKDSYDIVEWLAEQSWCDGSVAMWGGSYAGYDQWAAAKEFAAHLKTIVPASSVMPGIDLPFRKNIFYPYVIRWLTLTSGVTPNERLFDESSFWIQKFREMYLNHLPFKELDKIVGNPSPIFQTWIAHPGQEPFWDAYNPTDEQFARITIPILTITGHYDDVQPGAMEFYKRHMKLASEQAQNRHYLIIGPWDHAGTRTPTREVGGLTFTDASILDMNKLHKEWYDWTLKVGRKPEFLKDQVAYYIEGKEEWRYAGSLDSIAMTKLVLYLDSDGSRANDVFHSGFLRNMKPGKSEPDRYVYDPLDTRPAELEQEEVKNYITDERYALNLFGKGLVYHSEAFAEETDVSGYVKLVLWIAMDVPDADFAVKLYEIMPDGTSIYLTNDQLRARYRESLREEKLVKMGEINRYEFNGFFWFSREIAKGSRLRLVIACPNSIYIQKNYNSGTNVVEESGNHARTAHITLYHNVKYPSYLELPNRKVTSKVKQ